VIQGVGAMPERYIGLMSGTSVNGIDAVLAEFGDAAMTLSATHSHPYPGGLQDDLRHAMRHADTVGAERVGELHVRVGGAFRDAALALLDGAGIDAGTVRAIGSHGQTLRHRPSGRYPFTLQIGDAATIAVGTGIDTVADFRSTDVALGGEGAPLVPPFHAWLFGDRAESRVVLNLGGIANITVLPAGGPVTGFDTGPANTLLDAWAQLHLHSPWDERGAFAAGGRVDESLVTAALADPWFSRPPPKSTGFEDFNLDWLRLHAGPQPAPQDVQASLAEITARSIAQAIRRWAPGTRGVYVCGGGVANDDLMQRLRIALPEARLHTTADAGLDPQWVEAAAFAWLAMRRVHGHTGSLPSVTGARQAAVLGALYRG
jgi:anhydro-N-acetylmuramic acid kinase